MKKIILIGLTLISISFSIEKSDFSLKAGFRIIAPSIAKYASQPFFVGTEYSHNIINETFNLGVDALAGFGGSASERGPAELFAFWKLGLIGRYDFVNFGSKIPYICLTLGRYGAGLDNNKHDNALAFGQGGVTVSQISYYMGVGSGILFVLKNEDKINLRFEFDIAKADLKLADSNPLGAEFSISYMF